MLGIGKPNMIADGVTVSWGRNMIIRGRMVEK
jgi:hypothetical protein